MTRPCASGTEERVENRDSRGSLKTSGKDHSTPNREAELTVRKDALAPTAARATAAD